MYEYYSTRKFNRNPLRKVVYITCNGETKEKVMKETNIYGWWLGMTKYNKGRVILRVEKIGCTLK